MPIFVFLTLLWAAVAAPAQQQHTHQPGSQPAARVLPGVGDHHHAVSTTIPEAQQFFDQGLALIYAFNHEEAARAFLRATELDPKLAMAWWGHALAVGPNYNESVVDPARMQAAIESIGKAQALAAAAPRVEQDYIAALAFRFTRDPKPDVKQLGTAYSEAMRGVYERNPDDPDAAVLYADSLMNVQPWQLWNKQGEPLGNTQEIVRVLEKALARWPDHIGANHLYIHTVEASRSPERARESAARLPKLAPGAGHLVHMPSHVFIRTGEYEAAARSNIAAAEVDLAYGKSAGASANYLAMYYSHNLHFLAESFNRAGNYKKAIAAANDLEANVKQHIAEMPMVEGFLPYPSFVMLRFGKWRETLARPEPPRSQLIAHVFWQYAQGMALAGLRRVRDAQAAQSAMEAEAKSLSGETPFGLNSAVSVIEVARYVLAAKIATAQGRYAAALESWRQGVAAEDALNYDEPPGWYYPVRESYGAALLEARKPAEAETVFREDLANNPGNGRSLFGLRAALEAQGKKDEARTVASEFKKAWRNADTRLSVSALR